MTLFFAEFVDIGWNLAFFLPYLTLLDFLADLFSNVLLYIIYLSWRFSQFDKSPIFLIAKARLLTIQCSSTTLWN